MNFKPYPKYKDSGVQWIGEIPEEWEIRKVKHFSNSVAGGTPETTNSAYWDGNVPWLPSGMIHDGIIKEEEVETFITIEGLTNSSTKWIKKYSVLVALTGATCANIAYLTFKSTANQSVIGIECNDKTHSKYIFYYLISQREQILLNQTGGAQAGINKDDVKNLICAYPEKKYQVLVANFLDYKTSEISKTISADKHLIDLLKEKRTALINHVVTKGLNPKAKMKDSGIEWIGEVPEGWEINKIKNIGRIVLGKMLTPEDKGNYELKPYLRAQNILWEKVDSSDVKEMWFSQSELKTFRLKKNDLLVSEGGEAGRTAIWRDELKECYIQNSVHKITLNNKNNPQYLIYLFASYGKKGVFESIVSRVSIAHLTGEKLKEIYCIIPPFLDQLQIAQYLDKSTSIIDQTIKKIEEKIELLEEYKKSLIHHVVTGKVDVRESA